MSENQGNQNPQSKEEGGHRFNAQNIPAAEGVKRERADFTSGGAPPKSDKRSPSPDGAPRPAAVKNTVVQQVLLPVDAVFERTRLLLLLVIGVPLCIWASFPAWERIAYAWLNTLDYGHGLFIIPLTAYFLYVRRASYPGTRCNPDWLGLFPIVVYAVMRYVAGIQYLDAIEQWSIFFWILGAVWFFYGTKVFLWALPSLSFLIFMFQLPYSFDVLMRNHLQAFAAQFAAVLLQLVGEPAIPIKNTIRLSTMELGVESACSGLRFLISIMAIAFAAVLLMRRPWWQNVVIIVFAVPLALFVNASRIALTGILLMHFNALVDLMTKEGQNPSVVADEFSGLVLVFIALFLFGFFIWYLGKVFRRVTL
ncbi:MAG: exosortase/archaeosortase family protein [Planctomycetaceae bacterium]|nr:exosortase/archaeosortase family protein [Planctomycetaceae bacterium]